MLKGWALLVVAVRGGSFQRQLAWLFDVPRVRRAWREKNLAGEAWREKIQAGEKAFREKKPGGRSLAGEACARGEAWLVTTRRGCIAPTRLVGAPCTKCRVCVGR